MLIGKAIFRICLLLISTCNVLYDVVPANEKDGKPTIFKLLTNIARTQKSGIEEVVRDKSRRSGGSG